MSASSRGVHGLAIFASMIALLACSKGHGVTASADASTSAPLTVAGDAAPPAPSIPSREEGQTLLKNACLSCHAEDMLAQQRLTPAQWTKVVTKMLGWGANLEPNDTAPLIAWLTATYGVDAGPYEAAVFPAAEAPLELAPLPDGPFANGDAERGRPLYIDKCSGCHGPEARGHIGVLLVDRPFLYRAPDVAATIRRGRGKMTPVALSDAEIADILAHLRRLKTP